MTREPNVQAHSPQPMKPFRQRLLMALVTLLVAACATPSGSAPVSSPLLLVTPVISPAFSPSVPPPSLGGPPPRVTGSVTAGPVCPVEKNPPDPACAPRPVAGAVIVATDSSGQEVGRATTASDGSYQLTVSETGTFVITGLPVPGLMGAPDPVSVTLAFPSATEQVDLEYDTGIR